MTTNAAKSACLVLHGKQTNLDGEPITGTRFRFELLPQRLRMKLPPDCPLLA